MLLLLPSRRICTRALLQHAHNPLSAHTQTRNATLIRRPKRPYTFTQLVTLSDGSTFMQRTTSPVPVHISKKDTRNTILWNPSNLKLRHQETDEAGKLRAFRKKFGRGWDMERLELAADEGEDGGQGGEEKEESLLDLISGFKESGTEGEGEGKEGKKK